MALVPVPRPAGPPRRGGTGCERQTDPDDVGRTGSAGVGRLTARYCARRARALVICDESHNLRNNSTVVYDAIHQYIRANGSKVLLLTATPYNLAFADVANQIGLYIDDDDLGIVPTAALSKDPGRFVRLDGKINTLAAFRISEEAEDWKRLMGDHLVRRTRSFIRRTAKQQLVTGPDVARTAPGPSGSTCSSPKARSSSSPPGLPPRSATTSATTTRPS